MGSITHKSHKMGKDEKDIVMQVHFTRQKVIHPLVYRTGAGLIEVLVALLLLAVAVIGYSALQINAFKLMDTANKNTQALLVAQNLIEQVRQTPNMLPIYQQQFTRLLHTQQLIAPSEGCGLLANQSASFCTPQQLAEVNAYLIWRQLSDHGIAINVVGCSGYHGLGVNSNASNHCVIMAWEATNPTVGADSTQDCLSVLSAEQAVFYPKSQCLMMAVQ